MDVGEGMNEEEAEGRMDVGEGMNEEEKRRLTAQAVTVTLYLLLFCIAAPVVALVLRLCVWIVTGT
jgi:hypothetical protein